MSQRTHVHHTGEVIAIPDTVADDQIEGYANRIVAEAEARQADERALIQTIGKAALGSVATSVSAYSAIVNENLMIAGGAALVAMVAFSIITAEQAMEWRGKKKDGS